MPMDCGSKFRSSISRRWTTRRLRPGRLLPKPANSFFATAGFDDSKWRTLNLPHDWAVELPFVHDEEQKSHGYKPLGGAIRRPAWAGIAANSRFPPATWAAAFGSSSTALSATCSSS
jgi:hypothetical protein